MLPEIKKTDFGFGTSVLFCEIVGPIAQKRRAEQVPKDAFQSGKYFSDTPKGGFLYKKPSKVQ
jgi:hypothetical protein